MSDTRAFKKGLAQIYKLWGDSLYDEALALIEPLHSQFPGNPQLLLARASLIQLQENPDRSLEDIREMLQNAIALDGDSPSTLIEWGHFLDAVDDDPTNAARAYSQAAAAAKKMLLEALIGQAKSYLQIDRRSDALRCLLEALQISKVDCSRFNGKPLEPSRPFAESTGIEELLHETLEGAMAH